MTRFSLLLPSILTPLALAARSRWRRAASLGAVLVGTLALTAAGCDDDSPSTTNVTVADATTSTTAPSTTLAATSTGVSPVSTPPSAETSHLTAVRAAAQGEGDRVTFEFDTPAVPGYSVAYVDSIATGEGSSTVVLDGTKKIEVRFNMASSVDLTGGVHETYTGAKIITPSDTSAVNQLKQVSSFEATLTWGIGLRSEVPFTVSTLTNPARVVLDFGR